MEESQKQRDHELTKINAEHAFKVRILELQLELEKTKAANNQ